MDSSELLVIGAGPYGVATATAAIQRGIKRPSSAGLCPSGSSTCLTGCTYAPAPIGISMRQAFTPLRRFSKKRGLHPTRSTLYPSGFSSTTPRGSRTTRALSRENLVTQLTFDGKNFEASLDDGERISADAVVAAPGIRHFQQLPPWADAVPPGVGSHTGDLVHFEELRGARVLIVGGRQSAYEWAALIAEQGAERIDIVHRHDVPLFERVSWKFVDDFVDSMLAVPGWWRALPHSERERIARQFWEVGRLTLEWWLIPRLATDQLHRWPRASVIDIRERSGAVGADLSNGERLSVDRVVFATGYKANLPSVPYLGGLVDKIDLVKGFPRT